MTKKTANRKRTVKKCIEDGLIQAFIDDFEAKKGLGCVKKANAAFPIVWFGDSEAYFKSERRVVTVGLNPSKNEFDPEERPRFERVDLQSPDAAEALRRTLGRYFQGDTWYEKWFGRFEAIANLAGASYMKEGANRAIHIDAYSAIATEPTWSRLSAKDRKAILRGGENLFRNLLDELKPKIVLFTANQDAIRKYFGDFGAPVDAMTAKKEDGSSSGDIRLELRIHDGMALVTGRNNVMPFGNMRLEWLAKALPKMLERHGLARTGLSRAQCKGTPKGRNFGR